MPRPIVRAQPRQLGWKRTPIQGFVLPRLNEPPINTNAFGFTDPRRFNDGEEAAKLRQIRK